MNSNPETLELREIRKPSIPEKGEVLEFAEEKYYGKTRLDKVNC
jgi:hypothetical protein